MSDVVLVVTFEKGTQLPYRAGPDLDDALQQLLGRELQAFRRRYPGAVFRPRYTSVSPARIAQLSALARERSPASEDPGLLRTYEVRVPGVKDVRGLAAHLRGWKDRVRRVLRPNFRTLFPLELNPPDDAPANKLHYQKPAELSVPVGAGGAEVPYGWGVDAEYAWGIAGGRGEDMVVADVEKGWHLEHDDLAPLTVEPCLPPAKFVNGVVGGSEGALEDSLVHGACVLGILAGVTAGTGVTGCAHGLAKVLLAGEYSLDAGGALVEDPEPHNAILAATDKLEAERPGGGGVLLIEVSENWGWYDKTAGDAGVPIELRKEVHELIQEAVALGHTVIEAAGNGGKDLDTLDYALATVSPSSAEDPPDPPMDISDPAVDDSHAVLVGSTDPPIDKDGATWTYMEGVNGRHRRRKSSCRGKRIDCFAWGDYVTSCGKPPDQYVQFNGTSSAAAIVAGVVLILQGIRKAHVGDHLSPDQVREILRDPALATPVYDEAGVVQVGHMPDLFEILTASALFAPLELVPDVYLRDHALDVGDPHGGPLTKSPDIIVRQAAEPDPAGSWGEGTLLQDDAGLSQPVLEGHAHVVYVRARNRGKAAARGAVARVYWSEVATLITPGMWTEIGEGGARFGTLPNDDTLQVSEVLDWPADPTLTKGHYCFIASIGADGDQPPDLDALVFEDFAAYMDFVRSENGVTWRNFNVIEDPFALADLPPLPFLMPGAFDADREFELRIEIDAPDLASVELELPQDVFDRFGAPVDDVTIDARAGTVRFPVAALEEAEPGAFTLGKAVLPAYDARRDGAGTPAEAALHVTLTGSSLSKAFEVAAVQRHEGDEVGRVTWAFRPPAEAVG